MLTYTLEKRAKDSLYTQLYRHIRADILSGRLPAGQKLPSKRALAAHLQISVVTVETAYGQLCAEGYLRSEEKRGYFVDRIPLPPAAPSAPLPLPQQPEAPRWFMDFVTNSISAEDFPFTVWARLMRQTLLEQGNRLLRPTPPQGAASLRQAIADYLRAFRGMEVQPEQILIGAGTEVLYSLLLQLLGQEQLYAVEDPGYRKIAKVYRSHRASVVPVALDEAGLSVDALRQSQANVVHISPNHHYPTGIVMPIARRQALLHWAQEERARYILEDDYDSEFRFVGKPIPTLFSIDRSERVIYLNTFSKTIAPSIRIGYLVLPPHLLTQFRRQLGFYACTVSEFEQETLARFLLDGYFEKHLNRMRKRYHQKRDALIAAIQESSLQPRAQILEQDAGLHFLLRLDTTLSDERLRAAAQAAQLQLSTLSEYYAVPAAAPQHTLIMNYSGVDTARLPEAMRRLADAIAAAEAAPHTP